MRLIGTKIMDTVYTVELTQREMDIIATLSYNHEGLGKYPFDLSGGDPRLWALFRAAGGQPYDREGKRVYSY